MRAKRVTVVPPLLSSLETRTSGYDVATSLAYRRRLTTQLTAEYTHRTGVPERRPSAVVIVKIKDERIRRLAQRRYSNVPEERRNKSLMLGSRWSPSEDRLIVRCIIARDLVGSEANRWGLATLIQRPF
jgi:hypothetical protein